MVCKSSLFLSWLLHKNIKGKMRIYVKNVVNSFLQPRYCIKTMIWLWPYDLKNQVSCARSFYCLTQEWVYFKLVLINWSWRKKNRQWHDMQIQVNMRVKGRHALVGLTTICAISVYHHFSCAFEPRSWRDALYATLCDKMCQWLETGLWFFFRVLRLPPSIKRTATT